jgi:phenylpropionate dioxygenase-like ring-hydroxylating dioxygenase large terminal subunit
VKYSRSIIEIIQERSARRSYTPQPVEAEIRPEKLRERLMRASEELWQRYS